MCTSTATSPKAVDYSRRCVVSHPKTEPVALADTVVYSTFPDARRCTCGENAMWIGESALLAGVPRCPTCLAAHGMMWSGIGLSLGMAAPTWVALPMLAVTYVAYLACKTFDIRPPINSCELNRGN